MRVANAPYRTIEGIARNYGRLRDSSIFRQLLSKKILTMYPIVFLLGRAGFAGDIMPFGTAVFAACFDLEISKLLTALLVLLGMVSVGAREQAVTCAAAMLLFTLVNIPLRSRRGRINVKFAVTALISTLVPEIARTYINGFLLYDFILSLFQGSMVFLLVFIFRSAANVLAPDGKVHFITNEQKISIAITTAIALSGLTDTSLFGFSIRNVLCILVILIFSYNCGPGVGSAIGVTAGLIVSSAGTVSPFVISSYAFCGLLSGVLRNLGKVGAGLGFIMGNALITLYINGSTDVLIYLKEILAAVLLFMLLPQKLADAVAVGFNPELGRNGDKRSYSVRIKELTVGKLNKFSKAFSELSKTLGEVSETSMTASKQDVSVLLDRVADKLCKDCSLCVYCWDKNFYNTYQVMFKIIDKLDGKGRIEQSDIPAYFIERCERINDFVKSINSVYELFKMNMVWKSKIGESRGIVTQQLEGISKMISGLAQEIGMDIQFKNEVEDLIMAELKKAGLKVSEVVVYENARGKYNINIQHAGCGGKRLCTSVIEKLVSDIVGKRMVREDNSCYQNQSGKSCSLKLVEEENYRVSTGIAQISKNDGTVSGDCYTFMNTDDGKYILALSDGMGTGFNASVQSKATINLIEQFTESGFDKDTTVKLINSMLVIKSNDESFATIDLAVIDLYSGEVEFVKTGAAATYIKRSDGVETVKSATLPAGILSNIETELMRRKVESGEFIILMTDGVADAFKKQAENPVNIKEFINGIDSVNPQEIADIIMDKAYELYHSKPEDDMLVVAAKVWKRSL